MKNNTGIANNIVCRNYKKKEKEILMFNIKKISQREVN